MCLCSVKLILTNIFLTTVFLMQRHAQATALNHGAVHSIESGSGLNVENGQQMAPSPVNPQKQLSEIKSAINVRSVHSAQYCTPIWPSKYKYGINVENRQQMAPSPVNPQKQLSEIKSTAHSMSMILARIALEVWNPVQ